MEKSVLSEQYLAEKGNQLLKYISTVPHRGATFITPKGLYVWAKNVDHPGLIGLIGIDNEDEESIIDAKGWIRCDSGLSFSVNNLPASFVELPEKEITSEQYNALLDWIIKCCSGFEFQISVTNGEFKSYDMDYYGPEDLIKIIKYYYKQGVLKEDLNALNEMLLEDKIDMNDISELNQRKIKLLNNNNLSDSIKNMIKVKGLPAELHSLTAISDSKGRTEIAIRLYVNRSSTGQRAKVYLYITEDIFYLEKEKASHSFERIDFEIGPRAKDLSADDLIKLRALRVVFNVIKSLSVGRVDSLDLNEDIYVITNKTGTCNYRN